VPVAVEGARADRVIAFERRLGRERALVVVPRLTVGLTRGDGHLPRFGDTALVLQRGAAARRRDVLARHELVVGREARVDDVLRGFPVSVLVGG
jgi:maltooligosyltrehalose synthase